ncbi:multidrug transporter EmrE [Marinobacter sp. JH2]|uniref:DMT family transporter n=1 Tax=Marinobacter sp. AL4B TaxID=2871173 RepID=UPI00105545F3|nr:MULTISPECIES: SMR family transporter [unclassified Marinobacter]MBZ0335286.1 QacE family quaternary ammonium compound efflux SMR transporter [Marinobacter sp. AL4B]QBM18708.1 multidrug transporter EmrE [Marinobacter sp. JH2]
MSYVYLALAIFAEVAGTAALKSSEGFTNLVPSIIVVLGYGMAFYFLSLVLNEIPVGVAYAIWSGAGVVLISVLGVAMFGQKLDLPAIGGMALIISGIVVMNVFSSSVQH